MWTRPTRGAKAATQPHGPVFCWADRTNSPRPQATAVTAKNSRPVGRERETGLLLSTAAPMRAA